MLEHPLVSIMITSYNQKDILSKAVDSVLDQTYKNIQIVIADDGSTDGTQDVIHAYHQKFPTQIKPALSEQNQGIPKNKNKGFRACDGDLITYLDGDDYFFPEKIEKELQIFLSNPNFDIVYSNFMFVDEHHAPIKTWLDQGVSAPQGDVFEAIFSKQFPHKTLYRNELIKSKVLHEIGYYDEHIAAYHDWDSRIRMSKGRYIGYSDYVGSAYVEDPRGISKTTKRNRLIREMRFVIEKNSPLLNDLPSRKKAEIIKSIETIISKKEADINPHLFNPTSIKYLMQSGDLTYLKKVIKKSFATH